MSFEFVMLPHFKPDHAQYLSSNNQTSRCLVTKNGVSSECSLQPWAGSPAQEPEPIPLTSITTFLQNYRMLQDPRGYNFASDQKIQFQLIQKAK